MGDVNYTGIVGEEAKEKPAKKEPKKKKQEEDE